MASEELVTEHFQFLGIDVSGDILAKCVDLCNEYNIDAEAFVEQWMAFSLSKLNGAPPTVETLLLLERKELLKDQDVTACMKEAPASLPVYSAPVNQNLNSGDDVISNYISSTPKRAKKDPALSSQVELSPATYSPSVSQSGKYATRANAGAILLNYGVEDLLAELDKPTDINNSLNLNIAQVPNEDGVIYGAKAMFGFELLHEKAGIFDNHIRYLSESIMRKAGVTQTASVRCKSQTEVVVAGRVECDADARLNPKSVMLQGTWQESLSQAVSLDLDQVKQYSLFPGQVILAKGVNPRGDRFTAHEIYSDASLPLHDHKADLLNQLQGTLSLVVASGPYTTSDSLTYEPLKDLVKYCQKHKPHLIIMTGPFLDCEHQLVKDNTMAETYRSFFDKLLDNIADISTESPNTKIVLVSSLRDAFHLNIYPTPAYSSKRKHPNILVMPDPCTLDVNGIIIAVTSTDVLMHLSQEEISLNAGGDKLSRLAGHVLAQQCLAPLWPPPASLPVDAALWSAHAQLSHTPHILVLPSNFRYFVKEVNGCVVVNPEHLCKGPGGGTFARLQLRADKNTAPAQSLACQLVRI